MWKLKKGQLASLQNLVISLVVIGFVLVVGLVMMGKTRDTTTSGTPEYLAANATIGAIDDIPDWLPVIVIAVVGVVILGIVFLFRRFSGG